jgi:hypothetical protein
MDHCSASRPLLARQISWDLLVRAGYAVFGAVLALKGIYSPHRMIKWQSHLISELDVMPEHFAERLRLLGTSGNAQALREAETCWPTLSSSSRRAPMPASARSAKNCHSAVARSTRRLPSTDLLPHKACSVPLQTSGSTRQPPIRTADLARRP